MHLKMGFFTDQHNQPSRHWCWDGLGLACRHQRWAQLGSAMVGGWLACSAVLYVCVCDREYNMCVCVREREREK